MFLVTGIGIAIFVVIATIVVLVVLLGGGDDCHSNHTKIHND